MVAASGAVSNTATPSRPSHAARMVCFWIRGQLFGIAIEQVKEVIVMRPLTPVPFTPSWVAGLINLRGEVVSVIDLGAFLGLGQTAEVDSARIVIVRAAGRIGGLLADRVDEVRQVDLAALEPAPAGASELDGCLAGVITVVEPTPSAPIAVLDVERVLESERLRQFSRGSQA